MLALLALMSLPAPGLDQVLAPNANLERIATGYRFTEGAAWLRDGSLIFSDIPADTIYRWKEGQDVTVFRKPSGNANGNVLDREGRLLTCEHGGRRVVRLEKDGTLTVVAERFEGKRLNSPNDVVVHDNGTIYFTDPPYGIRENQRELDFNGVYRLDPKGVLHVVDRTMDRPNGIALSPDGKRLYVADTARGHLKVFPVQPGGETGEGKVFVDLKAPGRGAPDGLRVDREGTIFATGAGGVHVVRPDGTSLGVIQVPDAPATNVAWMGRDAKWLAVTAGASVYRIRVRVAGLRR